MMKRIFIIILLLAIPIICFAQDAITKASPEQPLQLSISSDKQVYRTGEAIIINVEMKNNSEEDILIVLPSDGSEARFRYPHCYFEVKNSKGELMGLRPRCGVTDPLTVDAFYKLKSNEAMQLHQPWLDAYRLDSFMNIPVGNYSIVCYYSTDTENEGRWHGKYSDDSWEEDRKSNEFWVKRKEEIDKISRLLKDVPRLTLTSNTITIELKDKNKDMADLNSEKNLEKRILKASSGCTEEECVPVDACCHTCFHHGRWHVGEPYYLEAVAKEGEFPKCDVDGCGRCAFDLEAYGYEEGRKFYVLRWSEIRNEEYFISPEPKDIISLPNLKKAEELKEE